MYSTWWNHPAMRSKVEALAAIKEKHEMQSTLGTEALEGLMHCKKVTSDAPATYKQGSNGLPLAPSERHPGANEFSLQGGPKSGNARYKRFGSIIFLPLIV